MTERAALLQGGPLDCPWLANHGSAPATHDRVGVATHYGRPLDRPSFVVVVIATR